MNQLFGLRRANGDWFAFEDGGGLCAPIFQSREAAMVARSWDSTMECFRPVVIDNVAFGTMTTTDHGDARFSLIADPLRNLRRGRLLEHEELGRLLQKNREENSSVSAQ